MKWFWDVLLVFAVLVLASMAYAAIVAAPWVPAKSKDKNNILEALGLKAGEKFYDLGCGDGWLSVQAARVGAKAVGYEVSLPLFVWAWIRSRFGYGARKARIRFGDFFRADLSDADTIYVFLMPKAMERLRLKLETQCRPGTRVVSYTFSIPGWLPEREILQPGCHKISVYKVPPKGI